MRYIICPHCGVIQDKEPKTYPGQSLMLPAECKECGKLFFVVVNWCPDYDTFMSGYLSDKG